MWNTQNIVAKPWLYYSYFAASALRGIIRKQAFKLPQEKVIYTSTRRFTTDLRSEWNELFGIGRDEELYLTYFWKDQVINFMKAMGRIGVKYTNVLHMAHEIELHQDMGSLLPNEIVNCQSWLEDICVLKSRKVIAIFQTQILVGDQILAVERDFIFIKGVSRKDEESIRASTEYNQSDTSSFIGLSRSQSEAAKKNLKAVGRFHVPVGMGWRFGLVSGDMNPIHCQTHLARLLGYEGPFLQGTATVNYLLKQFFVDQGQKLRKLQVSFCRPIYFGQNLDFYLIDDQFELLNESQLMVAKGRWASAESSASGNTQSRSS